MIHPYTPINPPQSPSISINPHQFQSIAINNPSQIYTQAPVNYPLTSEVFPIKIHEETYIERAKLNYKQQETKREKTCTQVVYYDTCLYSRGGRPYNHKSLHWGYDTEEDCFFNCQTCCCFLFICPMRSIFFLFYLLMNHFCIYIWRFLSVISDSLWYIIERFCHGIAIGFYVIFDIISQCFSFICIPFENCFKSICSGIEGFWNFVMNCVLWDKIGVCCSFVGNSALNLVSGGLGCCELVWNNCLGLVGNLCNFVIDQGLTNCLNVGKVVCESFFSVIFSIFDVLL